MRRGEYKTPGGKLTGVTVLHDGGLLTGCRVDGDFFIEGADGEALALIADIERALVRGEGAARAIARHPSARLVGAGPEAFDIAFARACGDVPAATPVPPAAAVVAATGVPDAGEGDDAAVWAARWAALRPRVVVDRPRTPREQMLTDERWARQVADGTREATIRFWQWDGRAVVIGRFQSLPDEVHEDVAAREGFEIVRRCTGGGAMFIEPGNTITYSLYAPRAFVAGMGVEESYRLCDWWLLGALRDMGVDARLTGVNDIASPAGKIGGAAQRRFAGTGGGSVLHHVTLAYDIDAAAMSRVLNTSAEKLSDKAVRSARKRVDPLRSQTLLDRATIVERMVTYLGRMAAPVPQSRP